MQGCLGYLLFMDSVDKSAFYIRVFSRNKYICLDAVYSIYIYIYGVIVSNYRGIVCHLFKRDLKNKTNPNVHCTTIPTNIFP